jgi:hypothetical protein
MAVDGNKFCETLEDFDRQLESLQEFQIPWVKQVGKTCIPRGTYKVILSKSGRFGDNCPEILDVPGFTHIRIHPLNYEHETEGCIGVGYVRGVDYIGDSRHAYEDLQRAMIAAITDGETIEIEIT